MAQQSGSDGVSRPAGGSLGSGSGVVSVKTQSVIPGTTSVEISEIQAEIERLLERMTVLEEQGSAQPFGQFEVGPEALASGVFVTIKDGKLYPCRSTDAERPIISGITVESGTAGQTIKVGILAGYRYELQTPMAMPSGMIFLGPDAKPIFSPPATGWFLEAGHAESSTTIYLDPDLAILRS